MNGRASRGGVAVSGREAEVFDLVGEHLTQVEIGERLFISTRTVESHVASLRRKLGMVDHRALVRLAVEFRSRPPQSSLPHEANSFVGRLAELDEVAEAMASSRVVTVVGPGGTGKTRLAIRAAAQHIGCVGQLRRAMPKTIRHRLLHIAARITPNSRRLRLDHDWPRTRLVIDAITRVRTAFRTLTVAATATAQLSL